MESLGTKPVSYMEISPTTPAVMVGAECTSYHRKQKNTWFFPPLFRQTLTESVARRLPWGCWICQQGSNTRNVRDNSCSPWKRWPQDAVPRGQWTVCPCFLAGGVAVAATRCAEDGRVLLRLRQCPRVQDLSPTHSRYSPQHSKHDSPPFLVIVQALQCLCNILCYHTISLHPFHSSCYECQVNRRGQHQGS